MVRHLRGNAVAYLALFIALGGSAYAAIKIEKNAVRSKHIKDGQVKNRDLANNAVTSPKVANGSLLGEDFAVGQLPAGPPGQDATNLFAHIQDGGTATVVYGEGVTGVTESGNDYFVAFNRNLDNCVAHATAGFGQPAVTGSVLVTSFGTVNINEGTPQEMRVNFETDAGDPTDTSFMVTAFC